MEPKPIDRWLGLAGAAVGVALYLLPKSASIVIGCLLLIFILLLHPLWHFWWIEESLKRRIIACACLVVALIVLGWIAWPEPPVYRYFP